MVIEDVQEWLEIENLTYSGQKCKKYVQGHLHHNVSQEEDRGNDQSYKQI